MKKSIKNFFKNGLFLTVGGYGINFPVGEKWGDLKELLTDVTVVIDAVILMASVVAVAMIIVGGYIYMTAGGDPEKVEQGQKTLMGSVIGLIVIWAVRFIILFVIDVFS